MKRIGTASGGDDEVDQSVKSNQCCCGRIGDRQTGKPKGRARRRNETYLVCEVYKVRI